ncbi:transposase [Mesorhizobium sp. M1E.F.Ca.ET.041.01.1.1]|nr:transposase [Mesorhizobium sp. M1E.F.Ca.ET.041.01.1.1]
MRQARELRMGRRKRFFNKALTRLIFIYETSTNTKLTKRTGWAPKGKRFRTHAPFGKWQTQTFIAGLRCHGLVAPWIVNAPMNAAIFERYVETQLAPELSPGDVVILDNVGFHKNERAAQLVRQRGAWPPLLAAILARPQPDRDGLFKTQGEAGKEGGQKLRCTLRGSRRYLPSVRANRMQKLLQSGRI